MFGESPWSDEIMISTLVDSRQQVQFQVDLNGYDNSQMLIIASSSPNENFSDGVISIDGSTKDYGSPSGISQGLLSFNELFTQAGIPDGVTIESAQLRFWTTNASSGPISVHQMYQQWNAQASWNSLSAGVSTDGIQAKITADDTQANVSSNTLLIFDVTNTIISWQNGQQNNGWAVINSGNDGWDLNTERYAGDSPTEQRFPMLTVFYSVNGDIDGSGVVDRTDLTSLRQFIGKDLESCTACDLNNDGTISMADLRELMLIIRNQ